MRLRYRSIAVGVPLRSPGHGAPIEARLIVRGGLLMIRPKDRGLAVVRSAVTVGGLLHGLSPPRNGKRRIAENWSKIQAALRKARDFTVTDATRRPVVPDGAAPPASGAPGRQAAGA